MTQASRLGRFGIWRSASLVTPELAAGIERLGFGALWLGGSPSGDLVLAEEMLEATTTLTLGTSIVNMWRDQPQDVARSFARVQQRHPGRHEIRDGTGGAVPGKAEHLRAQRGQHQPALRDALGAEHVNVAGERLVRPGVLLGGLPVTRAHPQQEPAGVAPLHARERARHVLRLVLPHVHDAGGEGQRGGRVEELLGLGQVPGRRRAQPQRAEAEPLDARGKLRRHQARAAPDAEPPQPPGFRHAVTLLTVRRVVGVMVVVMPSARPRGRSHATGETPVPCSWRTTHRPGM